MEQRTKEAMYIVIGFIWKDAIKDDSAETWGRIMEWIGAYGDLARLDVDIELQDDLSLLLKIAVDHRVRLEGRGREVAAALASLLDRFTERRPEKCH